MYRAAVYTTYVNTNVGGFIEFLATSSSPFHTELESLTGPQSYKKDPLNRCENKFLTAK